MISMIKPFIFTAVSVPSFQKERVVFSVNTSLFNSDPKGLETH